MEVAFLLLTEAGLMYPVLFMLILAIITYGIYLQDKKPQYIFTATMSTGYIFGLLVLFASADYLLNEGSYPIIIYSLISIGIFLTYLIKYRREKKPLISAFLDLD